MNVACSTLCFARYPLERALRMIGELEFSKLDVAIHEDGTHLRPSEVACGRRLRRHAHPDWPEPDAGSVQRQNRRDRNAEYQAPAASHLPVGTTIHRQHHHDSRWSQLAAGSTQKSIA